MTVQTEAMDAVQAATVFRAASGDRLQAAWETAFRRLPALHDTTKLRSWLLVIAANEVRRMARRRRLGGGPPI